MATTLKSDLIIGTEAADFLLIGDIEFANGLKKMGNDTIYGLGGGDYILGDAVSMLNSKGGNDTIYGGDWEDNIVGDAFNLFTSIAGNDVIYGGNGQDTIEGDADSVNTSIAGNDIIYGGNDGDFIMGDGLFVVNSSTGGNDKLYGENGNDTLYGEGFIMRDSLGGNDTLVGGKGIDILYGDAELMERSLGGNDTFVFDVSEGGDGDDIIRDFENDPLLALDYLQFDNVVDSNGNLVGDIDDLLAVSEVLDNGSGTALILYAEEASSILLQGIAYNGGSEITDYVDAAHIVVNLA